MRQKDVVNNAWNIVRWPMTVAVVSMISIFILSKIGCTNGGKSGEGFYYQICAEIPGNDSEISIRVRECGHAETLQLVPVGQGRGCVTSRSEYQSRNCIAQVDVSKAQRKKIRQLQIRYGEYGSENFLTQTLPEEPTVQGRFTVRLVTIPNTKAAAIVATMRKVHLSDLEMKPAQATEGSAAITTDENLPVTEEVADPVFDRAINALDIYLEDKPQAENARPGEEFGTRGPCKAKLMWAQMRAAMAAKCTWEAAEREFPFDAQTLIHVLEISKGLVRPAGRFVGGQCQPILEPDRLSAEPSHGRKPPLLVPLQPF